MIIKKVKKKHAEQHHGGNWKVAYADFMTAMMCFFLLMWLVNVVPKDNLKGVANYFTPIADGEKKGGGNFDMQVASQEDIKDHTIESLSGSIIYGISKGPSNTTKLNDLLEADKEGFSNILNTFSQNNTLKEFSENIAIDFTKEGLRIQIMDSENRPMFYPNTTELQPYMANILSIIAKMIKGQPNYLSISGHTATTGVKNSDLWNLSASRANKVRQFLCDQNIDEEKILKIVGNADKDPIDIQNPSNIRNIRVSITLLNSHFINESQKSLPDRKKH